MTSFVSKASDRTARRDGRFTPRSRRPKAARHQRHHGSRGINVPQPCAWDAGLSANDSPGPQETHWQPSARPLARGARRLKRITGLPTRLARPSDYRGRQRIHRVLEDTCGSAECLRLTLGCCNEKSVRCLRSALILHGLPTLASVPWATRVLAAQLNRPGFAGGSNS
jgi:hypothetical protein